MVRLMLCMILASGQFFHLFAGEPRYPVSAIDTTLLRHAASVVREYSLEMEFRSLNAQVIRTRFVVTLLKGSADHMAVFRQYYDDDSHVSEMTGVMYDAEGRMLRTFKTADIADRSAISDGILYADDRVKVIDPAIGRYPVTFEYTSELVVKRILRYPRFAPRDLAETAVEQASLEVKAPVDLFPRTLEILLPPGTRKEGDGRTRLKWSLPPLPALPDEPLSPSPDVDSPAILLGAVIYNMTGYKGDFSTWNSYGRWIHSLNEGREVLSAGQAARVRQLVEGIPGEREKVKAIYRFLQQTTRYVAVELGIGGFQSETAEQVATLGYGDCKGLVNYMGALLKSAGIPSVPVLVKAGDEATPLRTDFPGNQFNHVILCVPLQGDTVWLECTSQHAPFGFLGSFTGDRYGLAITDDGGLLVRTPGFPSENNRLNRHITVRPDRSGDATVEIRNRYSGLMFERVEGLARLSADQQRKAIIERYRLSQIQIHSVKYSVSGESSPFAEEIISMTIPGLATRSGPRSFIPVPTLTGKEPIYVADPERELDLVLPIAYSQTDSVLFMLPGGCRPEGVGPDPDISSNFGRLQVTVADHGDTLLFLRRYERKEGRFPPGDYNDFAAFTKQVGKQDLKKLVLLWQDR